MSIYSFDNQDPIQFEANFKFFPLSFSWVAIHPKPKGIIQFIGGALFGSFPTIFYDYLFRKLFAEGYTIIAFPFRFTFDHWSVSLQFLREQYVLRQEIIKKVINLKYDPQIYLEDKNYHWFGHSLGCKYILLLELLSGFEESNIDGLTWEEIWQQIKPNLPKSDDKEVKKIARQLENIKDKVKNIFDEWLKIKKEIEKLVEHGVDLRGLFIRNEPSLLIAPDISDTDSAIPIRQVADLLDRLGWGARPTKKQTQLLIENSPLFSLMAILSFGKDMIAGNQQNSTGDSDVAWLVKTLIERLKEAIELENTYHLEPHGQQVGKYVVDFPGSIIVWSTGLAFAPLIPFSQPAKAFFNEVRKPIIKTLSARAILEQKVLELLQRLKN
jgi:hypothetical protein